MMTENTTKEPPLWLEPPVFDYGPEGNANQGMAGDAERYVTALSASLPTSSATTSKTRRSFMPSATWRGGCMSKHAAHKGSIRPLGSAALASAIERVPAGVLWGSGPPLLANHALAQNPAQPARKSTPARHHNATIYARLASGISVKVLQTVGCRGRWVGLPGAGQAKVSLPPRSLSGCRGRWVGLPGAGLR